MTAVEHVHAWREVDVGCQDCGEHPGLTCDGSVPCPVIEEALADSNDSRAYVESWYDGENARLDLIFADDPRDRP